MRVVVSEQAKYNRNQIVRYILREFGEKAVLDFREAYKKAKRTIANHPESGTEVEQLSDEQHKYRFMVINGLSIMLYRVDEDKKVVYIVDMWDTRRQPPKIVRL